MLLPLCDSFNKVEDGSTLLKTLSLQWSSSHYVPALKIHTQLVASTQTRTGGLGAFWLNCLNCPVIKAFDLIGADGAA